MEAKASIHFDIVKTTSESHNQRITPLDYVHEDKAHLNEQWQSHSIEQMMKIAKAHCKKVSGRKMQKNAEPIREAVVNLKASHNIENLKDLANELQEHYGIQCFQIYIHRDEGREENGQFITNHHAHMLFNWQDQNTGKTHKLNRTQLSQIQTLVARKLDMTRGELRVNSNRERLEPVEFKRQEKEKELKILQASIEALEQKKNRAAERNQPLRARYENLTVSITELGEKSRAVAKYANNVISEAQKDMGYIQKLTETELDIVIQAITRESNKAKRDIEELIQRSKSK